MYWAMLVYMYYASNAPVRTVHTSAVLRLDGYPCSLKETSDIVYPPSALLFEDPPNDKRHIRFKSQVIFGRVLSIVCSVLAYVSSI